MMPKKGQRAPDFTLPDQKGKIHTLSNYRKEWVLLYFYPKDDTPGCTKQACAIRDNFTQFQKMRLRVLGISADSVARHTKFTEKYHLPFTLLSDEKKNILKRYGVWAKKKMMGREYFGILRTSFLIDPQGVITKVYQNVKPELHVKEVLDDMRTMSKP